MDNNVEEIINTNADDSDNDEVTDFLNSNCLHNTEILANYKNTTPLPCALDTSTTLSGNEAGSENGRSEVIANNVVRAITEESENYCIPVINTPNPVAVPTSKPISNINSSNNNNVNPINFSSLRQNDNNMIPTINVTPHSPANVSKYNNIFEDTLSQLQNIRESVVQMKNSSSSHMSDNLTNYGLVNSTILSASLPDLSGANNGVSGAAGTVPYGHISSHFVIWSPQQNQYLLNADRRKSWTGIDDLTAGGDCTNKSVSLSSLDSEEQETIRVTEQRRRSARNSTGDEEYQQNVVDEIAGDSFDEVVFTQSEDDFLFHVENEVITCTNDDEGTGKPVWIEPAVKFLISKVKELRPKVGKSASLKNKKQMWIKISEELCSLGYNFNSQQVETKYFSLERKYKRTQLYNSKTGRNRQTCPYQSELDDLLQEKKSINPDFVLDSEAEVSSADLKLIEGPNLSETGISTHSLNEAELARDFERIAAKRNLATEIISRIPLQKSISTSSIVAKEDIKAIARHLTDSEDENQSLLRAHTKIEVYDNVEKRRKRGSLFFRKKKDKAKMKSIGGQVSNCDVCGTGITLGTLKEHSMECKGKKFSNTLSGKKSIAGSEKGDQGQDFYDGPDQNTNFNDDNAPLIRSEFLNDAPIEAHDLKADPSLGIELKEHDSWSPGIPKDILKSLKDQQIKRQEHIYEFIMTEKHHCQTLLVMQKVFVESMERHFSSVNCNKMFPRLQELTELHCGFLKKLRQKQKEHFVVDSISDILLEFFSLDKAQHLRLAYGEFCANHRSALEQFKSCMTGRDPTFSEWYKHCLTNPLLKKKGIPECILFVTQRLTKYPLLIEPLLKSARDDKLECEKLQHALGLVKELLVDVDACVAEKELRERQIDIYNRIDTKSFAIYKNKPFRKQDVGVESKRRLKFEGLATLMQGRSKMQLVLVVVLTDCLCFLNENSAHNKYMFFTPEHKAGVVPLQKLLIREKAGTESRGIYIISSNPLFPEMYELKVQTPKDKNVWIQSIRQAVLDCPSTDVIESDDLTHEEKLRIGVNKREIIEKIRQKDIEQAILLEEKILLQLNLMQKDQKSFNTDQDAHNACISSSNISAAQFLSTYGTYKDISIGNDCDTAELWKKVLNTVQDITHLASNVYTAATGQPVSRSVSSVGEKQSDTYNSPILPKRAETFAGFDEKRTKNAYSSRDIAKMGTLNALTPRLQELEEKKDTKNISVISALMPSSNTEPLNVVQCEHASVATKDNNLAFLQVRHNLHTLLCIISQQMTTIHSLQLQLALYRESPRASYTHNDQLEELRNLQDKLQEEKTLWMRQKEQQEQDLNEKKKAMDKLQEQLNLQQDDIKQQREQLYRKMEVLSSQGLLISPNTPLNISSPLLPTSTINNYDLDHDTHDSQIFDLATSTNSTTHSTSSSTVDRRKDKWRTASTISKNPPVHLISATNAPKVQQSVVKQKLPMKLSSLSSSSSTSSTNYGTSTTKIDKSNSFTTQNNSSTSGGITQIFPLKLADKRSTTSPSTNTSSTTTPIVPQHSRTGSSPAIIQHPQTTFNNGTSLTSPTLAGVNRADSSSTFTYGQRYSIGSAPNCNTPTSSKTSTQANQTKIPLMSSLTSSSNPTATPPNATTRTATPQAKPEEEEIYF